MKVTAIESLHWKAYPRLMLVRVHTDMGLIGLGETVDKIPGSRGALHGTIAPLMLGKDPLDIEGLWSTAFDAIMFHGFAGAELRALSAVEIALWDILGKYYGAPVYRLLGGRCRDRVPTYNTCTDFGPVHDYETWQTDAGALARSLLEEGIRAMKIWPFDRFSYARRGQYISMQEIERGLKPIQQIREAAGDEMEIGIEFHFRWNRACMERIVQALEPYNILFLEDSIAAIHLDEVQALSRRTAIPIMGSALMLTRWQMREWLEKRVSQIVITEPLWTGGIAEARRIANMAEAFGVPIALHNVAGPVGHAACMHLGVHISNLFMVESVRAFSKTYFPLLSNLEPQVVDGTLEVPKGAGLGVELSPEALERDDLLCTISDIDSFRAAAEEWVYVMGVKHTPVRKGLETQRGIKL
ncbi:MAG: mandelate racemase/muconate lactonizing enzyme family protein [Anaerolineae bacterium]|nr:mandelate racemase/muconate lactonizing enzyme family protein [Anaerolineae bacterium]